MMIARQTMMMLVSLSLCACAQGINQTVHVDNGKQVALIDKLVDRLVGAPSPAPAATSASPAASPAKPASVPASPSATAPAGPAVPVTSADLRLALFRPENPVQLMLMPPSDIPGEIVVLGSRTVPVKSNAAWGLLIRSDYSGPGTVAYTVKLSHMDEASGSTVPVVSRKGSLGQRVTLGGRSLSGDLVPFGEDEAINLEPGSYTLDILLSEPESKFVQSARFVLQVG